MSNMSSTVSSLSNISTNCYPDLWYYQISFSLGISAILFILSKIFQAINRCKSYQTPCKLRNSKLFLMMAFNDKSAFGKLINIVRLLATIISGSIFIYVIHRENQKDAGKAGFYSQIYFCIPWTDDYLLILDFALQVTFFMQFLLSIFVASSISRKIATLAAIIEYFNIIPQILMVIFQRHNYAFRFVNFLRLRCITKILLQLNILSHSKSIILSDLICTFFSVWLTSAGIFQLLDALDENFKATIPAVKITYFDSMYFLIITMSTVGYGDILPITTASRIFTCCMIVFSISYFASVFPQLIANISDGKYQGRVKLTLEQKHVVVCGCISYNSVSSLISDFYSDTRKNYNDNTQLIFLSTIIPDEKLKTLCMRKWTKIQFLVGDPTNMEDLERVNIKEADCTIVLPDYEQNAFHTDLNSIFQVISIKNKVPKIRVIIQLLDLANSELVKCIPHWDQNRGINSDQIISISDIKVRLSSYSCVVPGFSTLIMNFVTHLESFTKNVPKDSWQFKYSSGSINKLFNVSFSPSFQSLTFKEAVKVCYQYFSVILVAVFDSRKCQVFINPEMNFQINPEFMRGLVLGSSFDLSKRIESYCQNCHQLNDNKNYSKCHCRNKMKTHPMERINNKELKSTQIYLTLDPIKKTQETKFNSVASGQAVPSSSLTNQNMQNNRSTQKISQIISLNIQQSQSFGFCNHIVICIPCCQSPSVDLTNYIQSMETFISHHSRDIVIITNADIIISKHLMKVYHLKESPLIESALISVNMHKSHSCLILCQKTSEFSDQAKLNCNQDKFSILCSLKVKSYFKQNLLKSDIKDPKNNRTHLITELYIEGNDQVIYPMEVSSDRLRFGFATGTTVNMSALNAFVSTAYSDPVAFLFIKQLLFSISNQQENIAQTNDNATQNYLSQINPPKLNFVKIDQPHISLPDKPTNFHDLFLYLLETEGIICLGLFSRTNNENSNERFVYSCPPKKTVILNTDYVYFFQ